MTRKVRFAGLACGGGKSTIVARPGMDVEAAYRAFGDAVQGLGGRYFCGPDVGTGETEMGWIREQTQFVNAPDNDASLATARGVLAAVRAVRTRVLNDGPVRAFVQGVGGVGRLTALGLRGDSVAICDVSEAATRRVVAEWPDVEVVEASAWEQTPCDLFVPCAIGPVVTARNVQTLPTRAVCGSANTQLESPALADALHERGVTYAPDFIVNAGAVIEGVTVLLGGTRAEAAERIDAIETRLGAVLDEAREASVAPLRVVS